MKAIIYCRQSLAADGDELGVTRQREQCERYCEQRSHDIIDTIIDNNVSASRHGRPGYSQLLEAIERRACDVVVILRIDRLLRLNDELEQLVSLSERTGVTVATCEGDIDLGTPSGRLMARVLVSVARAEMETKSARHKLANEQKARAGKPHGSRRPYGYEHDLITIRPDEAAVLRQMADLVLKGWSFKEIAYWLNEHGHTTTFGKPFYSVTVRNMLHKQRYGGKRTYHGATYVGTWQPIFEPAEWERLQLALAARERSTVAKPSKYLLTGLVYCGECGMPMNGRVKQDRPSAPLRRTYYCRKQGDAVRQHGCGRVRRNADALDHFIKECVLYRLDSPQLAELLSANIDNSQLGQLFDIRRLQQLRLDALLDDYASGLLDRGEFARAKATATAYLADIDDQIARAQRAIMPVDFSCDETLRAAWERQTDGWRRQLIALVIKKITINSGNTKPFYYLPDGSRCRFDPALIDIDWAV